MVDTSGPHVRWAVGRRRAALVDDTVVEGRRWGGLAVLGGALVLVLVVMGIFGPLVVGGPDSTAGGSFVSPSWHYPLGTDELGRSVLTRVVVGTRTSLVIAVVSVLMAGLIGTTLGLVSGFFGGLVDIAIGRSLDVLFGLPMILLAIAIAALRGPGTTTSIIAITIGFFPSYARVVRAPVLVERSKEYVRGARAAGASSWRIICRHIFPNVSGVVIVQGSILLSHAVLVEAALDFLGLGVQPPTPSWGGMLSEGRPYLNIAPWDSIFPGLAIFVAVVAFNLLGDGVRDRLDPKLDSRIRLVKGD